MRFSCGGVFVQLTRIHLHLIINKSDVCVYFPITESRLKEMGHQWWILLTRWPSTNKLIDDFIITEIIFFLIIRWESRSLDSLLLLLYGKFSVGTSSSSGIEWLIHEVNIFCCFLWRFELFTLEFLLLF